MCVYVCVSSLCPVQNMPVSQYNPWFCQGQQPQQPFATNSAVHANLAYKSAAACRHSRKDVGYAAPLQTFRYGSTNSSMMPSSSSGSTCNYNKIENGSQTRTILERQGRTIDRQEQHFRGSTPEAWSVHVMFSNRCATYAVCQVSNTSSTSISAMSA